MHDFWDVVQPARRAWAILRAEMRRGPAPTQPHPGSSVKERPQGRSKVQVLLGVPLLVLALHASARADDEPLFGVTATVGGMMTLGSGQTAVSPEVFVETDSRVPGSSKARLGVRLGITSEPGQAPDLADVSTFRAAEFALVGQWVVAQQDASAQSLRLSVAAEWGFSSLLSTGGHEPLTHALRHYGVGGRLTERRSGASLTVLYGRDEAAGEWGWGNWILYGSVPLTTGKAAGVITLTGDATLSVGPARATQRDILRLGVVVDLGAAYRAVK